MSMLVRTGGRNREDKMCVLTGPAEPGQDVTLCACPPQRSDQQQSATPSISFWSLIIDSIEGTSPKILKSVHTLRVTSCVATSTDILDLFYFLHMNAHTNSQPEMPPPFRNDYIQHPGSADRDGTNIQLLFQCKL